MGVELKENQKHELEHARWRVSFVESMLESHRGLPWRGAEWKAKEIDLSARLAAAQQEYKRLQDLLGSSS